MREILFRGKKYKTSVFDETDWAYGSLIDSGNHEQVAIYPWLNGASTMSVRQLVYSRMEAVKPETVGQYTGLNDKNGKKIFEGDILRAKVYEFAEEDSEVWGKQKVRTGNKIDAAWTVEYKNYNASCGYFIFGKDRRFHRLLTHSVIFNNECEVIGNIHDNPELLNGRS